MAGLITYKTINSRRWLSAIALTCLCMLLLAVGGCKDEMPKIPGDVIEPDEMVQILADMHIADSVAETKGQAGENEKQLTIEYHNRIFALHKITREQFLTSFKFYQDNPAWYNQLYEEMLTELSKREAYVSK